MCTKNASSNLILRGIFSTTQVLKAHRKRVKRETYLVIISLESRANQAKFQRVFITQMLTCFQLSDLVKMHFN